MENESNVNPLLEKKLYYEGCPGCKIEKRKDTNQGIPWKTLISVWVIVLCNALPISSLFPFLYFMIRDFHIAKQEEDVAYYAGFVGSAFMFGRALTSVFWGKLADRYGRKPIIIFGTISVVILNTLFGMSVNFSMAILTRFLLGSLCGLLGPAKAYVSEVCREEHQAVGMSMIATARGIGLIIGPALGGLLAQPAEKYPQIISQQSLFGRFPYLLPCLVISLIAGIVTVATFWLPFVFEWLLLSRLGGDDQMMTNFGPCTYAEETLHVHKPKKSSKDDCYEAMEESSETNDKNSVELVDGRESLLKNWPLISSIIVYCIFSFHDIAYSEILSLWAVSPKKLGGLSFSSDDVGVVLAITGFGMLIFQLIVYRQIDRYLGPIMSARICGVLSIPLLQSYPFLTLLSGLSLHILLNAASVLKSCLSMFILTGTFILQNRAVEQNQRGAANGISITAMSLFKAIGPACAGALFSWSEKRQDALFLPGTHMVFFLLNVAGTLGVILTFKPFLVERKK